MFIITKYRWMLIHFLLLFLYSIINEKQGLITPYIPEGFTMKALVVLTVSFLLSACGGSEGTPPVEVDPENYRFSISMQEMNLCGQTYQYSNYEVIAYNNDGGIISRHIPDNSGQVEASFLQSHVNLAIVRDSGTDRTDKKELVVSLFADFPVSDLGLFTVRNDDTAGCYCETATIEVKPGNLTTEKINLPHGISTGNTKAAQFTQTQLCEVEDVGEALLVVNHLDNDSGEIYYQAIAETSQITDNGALSVDIMLTGQVGRNIAIDAAEYAWQEIQYVTDKVYNYSVPGQQTDSIYVIDHERVEKIEFHASMQLGVMGTNEPVGFWGVHVPITDDTTVISYSKPDFEPEVLIPLLNNPTSAYNLDGSNYRVITGYKTFLRPDGTTDMWQYVLPSKRDDSLHIELPTDYLVGISEDIQYQELVSYLFWDLNEIPAFSTSEELYQSEWLDVFFQPIREDQVRLETPITRPPSTYSYVSLVMEF